jgi:YjbE family integral membrane protein
MDLGTLGTIRFDWNFLSRLIGVIIVNITLSGDNAVVIAIAVRSVPRAQRTRGIVLGTAATVLMNIVLTFFVARLLETSGVRLAGGLAILWLAVKRIVEMTPEEDSESEARNLWQALKVIVIANMTTSLDNMLAVGAASRGNLMLLILALATSIPIVVFASNLLTVLIDKCPIILYVGAAILGKVAGEMIMTDPILVDLLAPTDFFVYVVEGLLAIGVIVVGKLLLRRVQKVPIEGESPLSIATRPIAD